ncbi:dihydrodipicolinate synthase family protein [Burkholderia theae]|uniref:Dihydrodipicolinate synthase family protein n=1 Tax=Burkholderia theae TaxID=3143496 RepID=A0ABU9WEX2_9BURK|nr:dihydrodipicolinate synthase family protein [Burkholderia sp. Z1]
MSLHGNQVLVVTPFKPDYQLDEASLSSLIDHLVAQDVAGIIVLGTTGEFFSLTDSEKRRVIDVAAERIGDRSALIVGVAHSGSEIAADMAVYAREKGAAAVLAPPPYYHQPTAEGMIAHFSRIAQRGAIDMMVYDGGGGTEIPVEVVEAVLNVSPHMRYVKLTTPKVTKVRQYHSHFDGRISVFAGEDLLIMPELIEGADGLTTAAGNLRASVLNRIFALVQAGEIDQAQALHDRHIAPQALVTGSIRNEFIQCFKVALNRMGIIAHDTVRPPLHVLPRSRIDNLVAMLKVQGLL